MKVIAYVRVSTDDQADNGVSLAAQQMKAAAYASLYDLTIVETIVDAGESAKSLKRPGLQRALTMLRSGEAEGLVIVKLDRLTRSVADWQTLIDGYFGEKAGKQLFSVADSIDTRTAAGRLVLNVLLSVAQWERETTAERTREALKHKIRNGERCGKVRFGFDLSADGVLLVPNVAEQETIGTILSLRAKGYSFQSIADELTRRNITTKEGNAQWNPASVRGILQRQSSQAAA
ncbi:MAG: recombinase family protein [Planctomycetia bacterium]|nr:recombinase family protein [Planctomycetia bacterium]